MSKLGVSVYLKKIKYKARKTKKCGCFFLLINVDYIFFPSEKKMFYQLLQYKFINTVKSVNYLVTSRNVVINSNSYHADLFSFYVRVIDKLKLLSVTVVVCLNKGLVLINWVVGKSFP